MKDPKTSETPPRAASSEPYQGQFGPEQWTGYYQWDRMVLAAAEKKSHLSRVTGEARQPTRQVEGLDENILTKPDTYEFSAHEIMKPVCFRFIAYADFALQSGVGPEGLEVDAFRVAVEFEQDDHGGLHPVMRCDKCHKTFERVYAASDMGSALCATCWTLKADQ